MNKPLVTKPLAALAQRFQSEVPIAVSEGAKGTGKTLVTRYFIAQQSWEKVVRGLVGNEGAISALIVPVCASVQSSDSYQKQVDNARKQVSVALNLGEPKKVHATTAWLREQIRGGLNEEQWVGTWLDLIAWSCGFSQDEVGAGERFITLLRKTSRHVVALIEGLEELYASVNDEGVRTTMRAALVSLPQRLRSESRRPIGAVVFARRDTVEAAVTHNLDQYRREYGPYALSWTDDDVLELAAWLATQAKALPDLWSSDFGELDQDGKAHRLDALWGRKLGPDDAPGRPRVREAYTATWIIAVLSDLRGRLIPRDLVRLLSHAASVEVTDDENASYSGRLIVPRALKKAVAPTSEYKVVETEEEIVELKPIFEKFKTHNDTVSVPPPYPRSFKSAMFDCGGS